jgi:hypothetical protein
MKSAETFRPTRDNLPEAVDVALEWARQYRAELPPTSPSIPYADLAIKTLEHIKTEIAVGPPPLGQRTTMRFDYALVHEEPEFNRPLADLIVTIEDIYRRWYLWKPRAS